MKTYDGWWRIGDGQIEIELDDCDELNNVGQKPGFIDLDDETRKHICKQIFEDCTCGQIEDAYIPDCDIVRSWDDC